MGDRLPVLALIDQLLGSEREYLESISTPGERVMLRAGLSAFGPRAWLIVDSMAGIKRLEQLRRLMAEDSPPDTTPTTGAARPTIRPACDPHCETTDPHQPTPDPHQSRRDPHQGTDPDPTDPQSLVIEIEPSDER